MTAQKETMVFAVRGDTCIDTLREDGLTYCYGKTLATIQQEYPKAEKMTLDEFRNSKAAVQDGEAILWNPISEERFYEMLNVLPPAAHVPGAFMVGEPWDHHAITGKPRFSAFKAADGVEHTPEAVQFFASSRPMTHKEFCAMFGECSCDYVS